MNISEFLNYNSSCPVCGGPLTLFLRARKNSLWKGERSKPNGYFFKQFLIKNEKIGEDESFILDVEGEKFNFQTNTAALRQAMKTWQFFFFFICNEKAIIKEWNEYKIQAYDACYARDSTYLELMPALTETEDIKWELSPVDKFVTNINKSEVFTLHERSNPEVEKNYILKLNYEAKSTKLFYYTATPEQAKDTSFEPNIFEKEMPLPPVRPNFDLESRDKLINRLDSWILMS